MAITRIGSVDDVNAGTTDNTGTVSSTITVPADAEIVIVSFYGFKTEAGHFSGGMMTFTKGGVDTNMTLVPDTTGADATTDGYQGVMFYMVNPDTGTNKSLKWDWAGSASLDDAGRGCSIAFYKGIDTASPVRDGGGASHAGTVPFTTATMTAVSGDLIYAAGWGAAIGGEGSITTWTNATGFQQRTSGAGNLDMAYAEGSPSGNVAVSYTAATNWQDGGILAVVLKPAGPAGSPYTLTADTGTFALTGQATTLTVGPWEIVGVGTSVQVTGTAHALTLPAGVQQGDLLVAVIASRIASTTSITLPSGGEWTACAEQKTNNVLTTGSAVASGLMAYCIRGASDPNLTFTHPTVPSVALGRIVAYRGSYVGGWLDQSASATTAISTTAVSVAGVTTLYPNDLIVVGLCGGQEAAWSAVDATNPSVASGATDTTTRPTANTWIERAEQVTTTGSDTSLAIADAVRSTAGATGNITATASVAASHVVLVGSFRPLSVSLAPYTLTADQASFTLNGQAAGLKYGQVLTAAQGAFTLTGQAATLRQGYVLTAATQGAFALTGQTVALRRGRVPLVAAQGSFALNGQAATLRYGRKGVSAQGAFALTGQTATLKRTYVLAAAQAAFALNGFAVNLVYSGAGSKTMAAGTGMFALSGQTATLRQGYVLTATTQGAFALTGQTVFLRKARVPLVAAQGSFALNGQTVTLRYGHKTIAAQGAFLLNGQTATLKRARIMPAVAGAFTISGPAVILDYSGEGAVEMPAGVGLFALTGQTATLRYNRKGVSAQGSFLLNGQTALLKRSRVTPAATGMFAFTGQPVNLVYTSTGDRILDADPGTFALAGQLAELSRTLVTAPPLLEAQPGRLNFGRKVSIRRW